MTDTTWITIADDDWTEVGDTQTMTVQLISPGACEIAMRATKPSNAAGEGHVLSTGGVEEMSIDGDKLDAGTKIWARSREGDLSLVLGK